MDLTPIDIAKADKLWRRLTVMSGALDLFKTRRGNLARRDLSMARHMRFAGAEAKFCIAESKSRREIAAATAQLAASVARSQASLIERMSPDERETRIRAILSEIERLPYAPLGVSLKRRESDLRAELALLMPLPVEPKATGSNNRIVGLVQVLAVGAGL